MARGAEQRRRRELEEGFNNFEDVRQERVRTIRELVGGCWGTGELRQYDVSDPSKPVQTGSVRLGGIARRQAHPIRPDATAERRPADGGAYLS